MLSGLCIPTQERGNEKKSTSLVKQQVVKEEKLGKEKCSTSPHTPLFIICIKIKNQYMFFFKRYKSNYIVIIVMNFCFLML